MKKAVEFYADFRNIAKVDITVVDAFKLHAVFHGTRVRQDTLVASLRDINTQRNLGLVDLKTSYFNLKMQQKLDEIFNKSTYYEK